MIMGGIVTWCPCKLFAIVGYRLQTRALILAGDPTDAIITSIGLNDKVSMHVGQQKDRHRAEDLFE